MRYYTGFWTSNWTIKLAKSVILPEINPRRRIKFILVIFLIFWFHFIALCAIGIHIDLFISCKSSKCEKIELALVLENVFLLISFYSLSSKRESLKKLFKDYSKFEDYFNSNDLVKLRKIVNGITFGYMFFGTALMIVMLIYFTTDDDLVRKWYNSFNFFQASFQVQRGILFVYTASSRIFLKFVPALIILLYLVLYSSLTIGLCICGKEIARLGGVKFSRRFVDMYSVVNNLAVSAESAISLTTFFLMGYYYTSLYIMFSDIYYRAPAYDVIVETEKTLNDIVEPILFEVTFLVGTEVHNRDVELRKKLKDKIYKMSLAPSASWFSDNLSRFVDSKPVMTFTAFKMFSLTRAFILTSTGVVLTYSLLILQYNSAHEKSIEC